MVDRTGDCMQFELQPTLEGKLIRLRPLTLDDYDAVYAAASDPLIWEQHPESNRWERPVFQRYFDGAIESKGAFAVIDRATEKIIGSTRYCNLKPEENEVEIGWTFLTRDHWGGNYNGEMKSLMIAHAFRFVKRIVFVVGETNMRSQSAVQRIGGRFLRRTEAVLPDGTVRHNVVFAITR